jgi:hypothetical protein
LQPLNEGEPILNVAGPVIVVLPSVMLLHVTEIESPLSTNDLIVEVVDKTSTTFPVPSGVPPTYQLDADADAAATELAVSAVSSSTRDVFTLDTLRSPFPSTSE